MKLGFKHRLLSAIASLSLLLNSFAAPISVLAQEATPEPTPIVEETPTPTVEATPSPTTEITEDASVEASTTETTQESTDTRISTSLPEPDLTPAQESTSAQLNPTLSTDKADYAPTDKVIISGKDFPKNSDLTLKVAWPDGKVRSSAGVVDATDTVTTDETGSFIFFYDLRGEGQEGEYLVEILMGTTVLATTVFTDSTHSGPPPKVDLDQCANGDTSTPDNPCVWQNGNLNSNEAHYVEGQSVAYRAVVTNLPLVTPITLTLGYDIKHSDKHALDYLTHFNRLEPHSPFGHVAETINPISGVAGVSGTVTTFAIPAPSSSGSPVAGQPTNSFNALPAGERVMTLYGGNITNVAYVTQGSLVAAQAESTIQVTFTLDSSTAVLAWGGHIASRLDWGFDGSTPRSASGISGSPYHMRLLGWSLGNLGHQDRSLAAGAVIPPGNLTIIKDVIPNDSSLWDFLVTGPNSYSNNVQDLGDGGQEVLSVAPGVYTISETTDSAYSTSVSCNTGESGTSSVIVDISSSEAVICTFTNTLQTGTLRVIKAVTNDDGGTATPSVFNLHVKNGGVDVIGSPAAGSTTGTVYTLQAGSYVVSEDTPPTGYFQTGFSGDCDQSGNVTVVAGQEKTCTVTNDDQPATLHIVKVVTNDNGGTKVFSDFSFSVNGGGAQSFEGDGQNDLTVNAGTYSVTEPAVTGYSASYDNCSQVVIPNGGSETCTITNNDIAPTLTLEKTVLNDNGGTKVVSDFPLFINGVSATSGVVYPLMANTLYTATETQYQGYEAFPWGGHCATNGTITLQPGDNKTCTILNDDIAPTLTLIKSVFNNYGGNNVIADFYLYIDALLAINGTPYTLNAGSYTASEGQLSGYTPSSWGGACSAGGGVTLLPGDNKTCTISNSDIPASITLIKAVINNNGGNAGVNDFGLSVGGTPVNSGVTTQVNSNTPISINEVGVVGYSFVSITGDAKCPSQLGGTVTLNEGENISCTITNDDEVPTITLIKNVINNSGGQAGANDFGLTIGGNPTTSGTPVVVDANTPYVLNEAGLIGYSFVSITGDPECPSVLGGTATLDEGEDITCTITNDDQAATLHVVKVVTNDNGGTKVASDFSFQVNGGGVTPFEGDGQNDLTVNAGTYSVTEPAVTGYSASYDNCSQVVIPNGGSETCTITNDDNAPSLTLVKVLVIDNGGDASESDWTLTATGPTGFSGFGPSVSNGDSFDAGTYNLSESTGPTGYDPSDWECVGGSQTDEDTVVIGLGDQVTCTITNDDIGPLLTVIKEVVGGTAEVEDFNLYVGSTQVTSGDQNGFDVGSYVVSEDNLEGYTSEISGDCDSEGNVTLDLGDEKTCTITNLSVSLSSIKSNVGPSEVLVGDIATFQVVIENTGNVTLYNPIVFDIFDTDYVDFDSSSPIAAGLVLDDIGPDDGSNLLGLVDYDGDGDTAEHIGLLGWEVPVDLAPGETYTITLYFLATAVTPDSEEVVSTNGIVTLVCLEDTEECSEEDTLETEISYASVDIDDIGISIAKSNNKPSASAGETVTYTLVVTSDGESPVFDVEVTDSLPGGFTYVPGSTIINGSSEADPSISGNNLTWNVGTVVLGEPVTIVYQATIASDVVPGTYTNLATCQGELGGFDQIDGPLTQIEGEFGEPIECNVASSNVGIGRGTDFSGNIPPQVLGAATELPAAGSDTALLVLAIMALIAGVSLKGTAFALTHAKPKRRKYAKN